MKTLKINSDNTLSEAIGAIRQTYKAKKYLTIKITTGKGRTASQNAISHTWYAKVAREEGEYDAEGVKCLCKYHKGLPILRADDSDFNAVCEQIIDPLPYEAKIKAMIYLPVTSRMTTKQLSEYMESVQRNYADRVDLQFPEED